MKHLLLFLSLLFLMPTTGKAYTLSVESGFNSTYSSDSLLIVRLHSRVSNMYFYGDSPEFRRLDLNQCENVSSVIIYIEPTLHHLANDYGKYRGDKPEPSKQDLEVINQKLLILFEQLANINYQLKRVTLIIDNKYVEQLPSILFAKCNGLKELEIKASSLKALPSSFNQLTGLKKLTLNCPSLDKPFDLSHLIKVQHIFISSQRLKKLGSFPNTVTLSNIMLDLDKLKMIPESIGVVSQLKDLNIRSNKLKKLPSAIAKLTKLNTIILNTPKLKVLPKNAFQSISITSGTIYSNKLKKLPNGINSSIKLKTFQ